RPRRQGRVRGREASRRADDGRVRTLMNRIDALFTRLKAENRRALMPFITAGDPDLPTTAALIAELVACGAHMVEIGIPYSGPIVPDLPVEKSEGLCRKATALDLRLIQLVTPTTPRARAVQITRSTTGFVYYVSVAGLTGERRSIPPELVDNVAWLRTQTDLP